MKDHTLLGVPHNPVRSTFFGKSFLLFLTVGIALGWLGEEAISQEKKTDPARSETSQVVFVISETWESPTARLTAVEDRSGRWVPVFDSVAVTLGRTGTGVGLGLHRADLDGPKKKEGDKRAPAGIFPLEFSFGTKPKHHWGRSGLHYFVTSPSDFWVDDPASAYYNRRVDRKDRALRIDWKSAEQLRRTDGLYDLVIVVGHNRVARIKPGHGSAIFLHRWSAPGKATIGCTAMAPDDLKKLWRWLDPKKNPLLIQGPGDFVKQLHIPTLPTELRETILRP